VGIVLFGYRRTGRTRNGTALPPPTPDRAARESIREAEQIVCQVWESVLLERGGRMESAVLAAHTNCHTAYGLLAEAQRGGDPGEMSAASANLHEALDVARRSVLAAERVRETLSAELDLLTRASEQRRRPDFADQPSRTGLRRLLIHRSNRKREGS
jgi:uncharacterized membrane protein YccC